MAIPVSSAHFSWRDYSKEISKCRLNVTTLTAGNLVATLAAIAALESALSAVTLGVLQKYDVVALEDIITASLPTDKAAQRESKWLARYHDANNGHPYRFEIPCADTSILATNSDFADTTAGAFTGLKSAFEAVVISPNFGGAVVFDSLEFVGKRL